MRRGKGKRGHYQTTANGWRQCPAHSHGEYTVGAGGGGCGLHLASFPQPRRAVGEQVSETLPPAPAASCRKAPSQSPRRGMVRAQRPVFLARLAARRRALSALFPLSPAAFRPLPTYAAFRVLLTRSSRGPTTAAGPGRRLAVGPARPLEALGRRLGRPDGWVRLSSRVSELNSGWVSFSRFLVVFMAF